MRTGLLIGMLCAGLAAGCVTERKVRPGLTVLPQNSAMGPARGAPSTSTPVELPSGPVAAPAAEAMVQNVRVVVRVDHLASIPYDGQVLPLVSPDGRFLAVQQGEPPTWPTMLAQPAAEPPTTTRITVYDISQSPPDSNTRAMEFPSPLPPGLMLGRACDHLGFLVESPRPDGSRWIGRVSWIGGTVQWLVQGGAVNAHAVLTDRGELLYTRRPVDAPESELVLLTATGESVRRSEGAYMFPVCTTERDLAYAFNLTSAGLAVEAIRIVEDPPGSGLRRLGRTFAQALIGKPGDAALAYQVSSPVQNVVVSGRTQEGGFGVPVHPLIFYHPDLSRMVAFDTQFSSYTLLAPNSIAAIRWSEGPGYLCTAPQGLVFTPEPSRSETRRRPDSRLDSTPYVPRATAEKSRPVLLFGPSPRDPNQLWVRSLIAAESPTP
ncbi:MAG: hypothetical protein KF678_02805 [Phycisphaeraceae bacterium]|nr:hypothetical protein [Phycisphaeraceae bacterium]